MKSHDCRSICYVLADGSYWVYQYDDLGQVTSGKKYWAGGTPVPGQQFGYDFDDIGNRKTTTTNGRQSTYASNLLNQYDNRTVPGAVDVIGSAETEATVTINNQPVTRYNEYFHKALSVTNTLDAVYQDLNIVGVRKNAGPNQEDIVTEETGHAFVPKTPEIFQHDDDQSRGSSSTTTINRGGQLSILDERGWTWF